MVFSFLVFEIEMNINGKKRKLFGYIFFNDVFMEKIFDEFVYERLLFIKIKVFYNFSFEKINFFLKGFV